MKLLALTIGAGGPNQYNFQPPAPVAFLSNYSINSLIQFAITLSLSAAILLAFIFFLIGGLKWLTSQGDKKKVEEAQKTITYSIVGLILVLLSMFIINLIGYLFQVPLLGKF